jgi:hypothetical protein
MSTNRNAYPIKQGGYRALGMLIGMLIGLAMENIPLGIVFGLSVGMVMQKHAQ